MKIIQELLKMKFPTVDINSLMEIIAATPNPEIATEIMCNIYEEPKIGSHTRVMHKDRGLLTFISYDKWTDKLEYSYVENSTQGGYFPRNTKKEDITMDNFESMKISSSTEGAVWLSIPTGKTRNCTSTTSFSTWMSWEYAPTEVEQKIREAQNLYC
jgi:hypothetical protein